MIHRDVYVCLSLCARETTRIKLATGVTNPVTRDVSVSAGAISTLNEVSSGRALLGIGPGDSSVRRIGLSPERIASFESYVATLRELCSGNRITLSNGETVSMRWSSGRVPVLISATGLRMLELAGRIGDGVIINVGTSEKSLSDAIKVVSIGRGLRENDQGSQFTIADFSFINISESRHDAIEAARPYVIWFLKNSPRLFKLNGISIHNLESNLDAVSQKYVEHDYIHSENKKSSALDVKSFVTDEMVDKFAIAGTPEDCVRKIKEKERLGVNLFIARHTGDEKDWKNFLNSYCENVLPSFG
jgi:5,10-methylenetetrahydromethanopterin reductase